MRIQPKSFVLGLVAGVILVFIVRLLPVLFVSFAQRFLVPAPHTEIEQTIPSPDGRHIAYVLIRDSGATTAPSKHVAVAETGQPVPEVGNLFRARGPGGVSVRWEEARTLVVTSEAEVRFFDAMAAGVWATLRLPALPARGPTED